MNGRPDMMRPPGMPHLPQNVLGMNQMNQSFLPPQQAPGQPPPGQQPHMAGLMQNSNNMNPNMGFIPGSQPANPGSNPNPTQMTQLQFQQSQQRRQVLLQQSQHAQNINSQGPGGPSAPHLNGIGQAPGFPGSMMPGQQPNMRRTVSQPHTGGPPGGPMGGGGGVHPGGQGMAVGLGMSIPGGVPGAIRQQPPPMGAMRPGPPNQQPPMSGHPSMAMNRQGQVQGMPNMPQNMGRAPSAQAGMMGNMNPQLPPGQQHSGGMPPHGFPNAMSHQSSPMGSSPRPNNPSQALTPQSAQVDHARMTPDNPMYMSFPTQPQPFPPNMPNPTGNMSHPSNRIPGGGGPPPGQSGFGSSSTPPSAHHDGPQGVGPSGGPPSAGGPPGGPPDSAHRGPAPFITPAQQLAHMQPGSGPSDPYTAQFGGMAPPPSGGMHPGQPQQQPPRPRSQQRHTATPHLSPQHSQEQLNGHLARPPSQPQAPQQQQQPRPPSQQSGASRTPRGAHQTLPRDAMLFQGRPASIAGPPPPQPPHQGPPQPQMHGSPPAGMGPGPSHGQVPMGVGPTSHSLIPPQTMGTPPDSGLRMPLVAPPRPMAPPVGLGQGLMRLLQFSGQLAYEGPQRLSLSHWDEISKDFFLPTALMKLTLWKDNQKTEAKVFEVGTPILPRFFLVTSQSGVKSMSLSLDGAVERPVSPNHASVECTQAIWTYKYNTGYIVTLKGPFRAEIFAIQPQPTPGASVQSTAHPNVSLKIDLFSFDSTKYEKHVSFDSIMGTRVEPKTPRLRNAPTPTLNGTAVQPKAEDEKWDEAARLVYERASIPSEPVNAFGIPQATMRCLELAESVAQMSDLIQFSSERTIGPKDALTQFAQRLRETHGLAPNGMFPGAGAPPGSFHHDGMNGAQHPPGPNPPHPSTQPAVGLANVGLFATTSSSSIQQGMPTPSSMPSASPRDKPKGTPKQANAPNPAGGAGASTSAHSTPANPASTPSMANASLKRKAQSSDTASPTTANAEQPPAKRNARKRGRTGTTG